MDNPVFWSHGDPGRVIGLTAVLACAFLVFLYTRAWMDAVMSVWMWWMITHLHQSMAWHVVILLPWLIFRASSPDLGRAAIADQARLVAFLAIVYVGLRNPLIPAWLAQIP